MGYIIAMNGIVKGTMLGEIKNLETLYDYELITINISYGNCKFSYLRLYMGHHFVISDFLTEQTPEEMHETS